MSISGKMSVFQDLDRLFRHGISSSEDGALVHRFRSEGNEPAFEALVARHGPMVRGVCKRLLANPHDADDAFQATFLVLVQKAKQLRDPDRIGPWLYGVARRVATKARARSNRHRHDPPVEAYARDEPKPEWLDVMPIVDDELGRLPAKHRDVLVLCLLNGASPQEAATSMGCPVGTVKSRLARAREALRGRLENRGIAPAVALAAASSANALTSPVSPALTHATLELLGGSSVAPGVLALTKGVFMNMLPRSFLISSMLVGGVAVAGLGTASWINSSTAQEPRTAASGRGGAAEDPPQQTRVNNMKQILLAFHNYYQTNGRFPAVAIYGSDGSPKLSWRVALLPYLDQNELYNEFHQDEPWDSPHNHVLLDRMPAVFETPDSPAASGKTRLQGFAGKGAMFEGTRGVTFADVTDGTSNTALITMARDPVPWTKPADLPFVPKGPLPSLDDQTRQGIVLGMTDGSVHALPPKAGLKALRSIITRAGGEVIDWLSIDSEAQAERQQRTPGPAEPQPVRAAAKPTPSPTPSPAPLASTAPATPESTDLRALEARLRRVEDKLERLIQRLEEALPAGQPGRN